MRAHAHAYVHDVCAGECLRAHPLLGCWPRAHLWLSLLRTRNHPCPSLSHAFAPTTSASIPLRRVSVPLPLPLLAFSKIMQNPSLQALPDSIGKLNHLWVLYVQCLQSITQIRIQLYTTLRSISAMPCHHHCPSSLCLVRHCMPILMIPLPSPVHGVWWRVRYCV
jgi:hypothetical protein